MTEGRKRKQNRKVQTILKICYFKNVCQLILMEIPLWGLSDLPSLTIIMK